MKKYYINPDELKEEVIKSQRQKKCTEELGKMLLVLHDKVLSFDKFRGYDSDIKEEMKSWSVERFLRKGIYSADPDKNLFAYFTSGIVLNYINRLKRLYIKKGHDMELVKQLITQFAITTGELTPAMQEQLAYILNTEQLYCPKKKKK